MQRERYCSRRCGACYCGGVFFRAACHADYSDTSWLMYSWVLLIISPALSSLPRNYFSITCLSSTQPSFLPTHYFTLKEHKPPYGCITAIFTPLGSCWHYRDAYISHAQPWYLGDHCTSIDAPAQCHHHCLYLLRSSEVSACLTVTHSPIH